MQPDLYDHFEATNAEIPDGVYRAVGRDDESVTLLRVGDADGRRVHTGAVVTVGAEALDDLAPSQNPDGSRSLGDVFLSNVETGYWSIRVFGRQLALHVFPTVVAVLLVLGGAFGDRFVSLPDVVFGGFVLLGSLALAYIGSGRL